MYISWSVARLVRVSDFRFYSMLKFCLQRSLWSLQVQHDFIKERKIDTVLKRDQKVFYCHLCRRELFLYIWVRRKEDNNHQKRRSHCQASPYELSYPGRRSVSRLCWLAVGILIAIIMITTRTRRVTLYTDSTSLVAVDRSAIST